MANRLNNRRKDEGPDSYRVIQVESSAKHPQRVRGTNTKRLPEDAYKDVQGIIDEEFQSSFSGFRNRKPPYVHSPGNSRLFPGDQKRDGANVYNRRNGNVGGRPGITRHDYREDYCYIALLILRYNLIIFCEVK